MMPVVARVPMIPVQHHTAPSHPNIPVCTKWGVSDCRSEGTGTVGTGTSQGGVTGMTMPCLDGHWGGRSRSRVGVLG